MADVKKVITIEIDTEAGQIKLLNKELDKTEKQTKKATKSTGGLSKGFKAVGSAMKAAGIGLIVGLIAKLTSVLNKNQKFIDAFSVAMDTISITLNQVVDSLENAYDTVVKSGQGFDALGKVLSGVLDLALKPFQFAWLGIQKAIVLTQRNWEESIFGSGDVSKIQKLNESLGDIEKQISALAEETKQSALQIYDNFSEAIDEVVDFGTAAVSELSKISIEENIKQAQAINEIGKAAELAQVQQQGLIEKYDREAELLRQIRDETNNTFEERIEANEKLGEVLDKQGEEELKLINLRQAALEENFKAGLIAQQEYLVQRQELANEEAAIEARITGFRSEQLINRTALANEQAAAELEALKKVRDAEKKALQERKKMDQERADSLLAALENVRQQEKKEAELRKAFEQEVANNAINLIGTVASLADSTTKRGFQIQKAAAIAAATANTAQAVTKTLAETADFTPTQTLRFINAALVGAAGAAQIAAIARTKFTGGGGGSAPSVGGRGGGAGSPNIQFNTVGASGINQLNESIVAQNTAVKAYVVSSEVSSAQSLDRNRQSNATFG